MKNKGFTLAELLVTMVIFVAVISAVIAIFGRVLEQQRRTFTLQNVQDNARYALEAIAREVRMADVLTPDIGDPQAGGFEQLEIINYKGEEVVFRWFYNEPYKQFKVSRDDGATFTPLTSEDVEITNFQFYVRKCTTGEDPIEVQPRVTVSISIRSADPLYKAKTEMYLATTVSTRMYKQ